MSSAKKAKTPDDPDPTPIASADSSAELASAARNEKKKIAKAYGRNQTVLAGSNSSTEKKTVLGG